MVEKMRRNIRLLAYLQFGHMFMIAMAVIVPFWNELGLDQQSIYQLQTVFLLTVVIVEVPSGYFADRFGRRTSLVYGHLLWTAGWVGYSFASSWSGFAVAEVLMGLGVGLTSGADGSLRYDSLQFVGDEHTNLRESSRAISFGSFGEGIAGIVGGGLAILSLRAPIIAQGILCLAMIPIVLALTEAPYERDEGHHMKPWQSIWRITKLALHDDKRLKWLVLYSASLGTMTYTAVWLMQPFYLEVGVAIGWFGILWFIKHMFLAYFGFKAEAIRNHFGLKTTLIALPIIGVLSYLLLAAGYSIWVLPAWIGFELVRGVQFPVIVDAIHQRTTSSIRATVISVNGLVLRGFFAIFALAIGAISNHSSIRETLLYSAFIYAGLIAIMFIGLTRNVNLDSDTKR